MTRSRVLALLAGTALLLTPAYIALTGAPGVDWALVLAYLVAGGVASLLAVLTLWLAGRPLLGWYFDRRTGS